MTIERFKELHEARPFKRFVVCLADGCRIRVTHPEALARRENGRTIVILDQKDRRHFVDLLLVTDLVVGTSTRSRKNGNGKH